MYDGNGSLLTRKVYNYDSIIEKRDYIGNFEYVDGVLESIRHSEGRYKSVSGSFSHEYVMKDHLGNTRLVYSDLNNNGRIDVGSGEILQESHFYPFGMEFSVYYRQQSGFDYNYKFNGIERIKDLDLDLALFRSYDYDPVIGRWMQTDPLADIAPQLNSYRFGMNNPVNYTNHLGLFGTRGEAEGFLRKNEFLNNNIGEWSVNYSGHYGLYTVSDGTNTIIDLLNGFGPTYILPDVMITAKNSTASRNNSNDKLVDRKPNYGLYVSTTALGIADIYSSGIDRTLYTTTEGWKKKFPENPKLWSRQARMKYRNYGRWRFAGEIGTGLMAYQAIDNFVKGDRSVLNASNALIGTSGFINSVLLRFTSYGSSALGRFVPIYGAGMIMIDVSIGERNQIRYNIMNNRLATEGVYNPSLGFREN